MKKSFPFKNDITFNCNSNYIQLNGNIKVYFEWRLSSICFTPWRLGNCGAVEVEWLLELHTYHLITYLSYILNFVKFIFLTDVKKSLNICILKSIFILKITCISNQRKDIYLEMWFSWTSLLFIYYVYLVYGWLFTSSSFPKMYGKLLFIFILPLFCYNCLLTFFKISSFHG